MKLIRYLDDTKEKYGALQADGVFAFSSSNNNVEMISLGLEQPCGDEALRARHSITASLAQALGLHRFLDSRALSDAGLECLDVRNFVKRGY